ncbi:VOC family protein [Rhodococcus sp. BP-349]|uniref:VOC family protein n=1 Tax=unclassified Rhodococcus (in: high G+C Gram-positive bacteria) TaxID=192944 RepID=UPI001C9AC87C|nr:MULTISPECIES: VOC family protein [unclassified Rhodococcus (in: high G+C Gram-positive bacteria)]MBY6539704.1 VOC family protein [Rhodococcus sp. BP-363]MBY6543968.1 VOC family protein [Rhodococcus sp. BP-369]MBY6563198.1 VOC family protein [Rhodococcus sp. BP-370]MBY6577490.1 VOC family protein [Rhodococcus sp. BP-364]MBY6586791.1 VOC family protein [Rhodococcus sp. BP-358]
MEVLASRIILRPRDFENTLSFYRDRLRLGIFREYPGGVVFFAGQSLIEVAGHGQAGGRSTADGRAGGRSTAGATILLQVRDVEAARTEIEAAGVEIVRPPQTEPWGLTEMWIADPDGTRIVVVEVPPDHPQRRG